jgi:hypothetical protein
LLGLVFPAEHDDDGKGSRYPDAVSQMLLDLASGAKTLVGYRDQLDFT